MRSTMKVLVPAVGILALFGTALQRQAQAEERAHARIEAVIAAQRPPAEVSGSLSDGADLARQILSLRGE